MAGYLKAVAPVERVTGRYAISLVPLLLEVGKVEEGWATWQGM